MTNFFRKIDQNLLQKVDRLVATHYGVAPSHLYAKARDNKIAYSRFVAWSILHFQYQWSYKMIAAAYHRQHSTIISGLKKAEKIGLTKEAIDLWKKSPLSTYPHR